ncbi:MAG: hypothetical protein U0270_39035 [Labilithrix sp.]
MRVALGVGATLVALLASCKDEGGGGDVCSQYYDATISYQKRCSKVVEPNAEAERSRFLTVCSNLVNAPGATNIAGALQSCASQISANDCSVGNDCDVEVVGTLPDGAACLDGSQCASGGCDDEDGRCGHCVALAAIGQPCGSKTRCVKDASCVYSASTNGDDPVGTCRAVVRRKAGESCESSTTESIRCEKGLACSPDAKCEAGGAAGAACSSTSECQNNLVCDGGTCGVGQAVGGACTNSGGTAGSKTCAHGLVCPDDTKTCSEIAYVAVGQPCDYATRQCLGGYCRFDRVSSGAASGTCTAYLADGAACDASSTGSIDQPRCDRYADCIDGKCQIPNPAACK